MVETRVPGTPSERPGIASLRDAPDAVDGLDADLRGAAATVARVPELLVACDYDGTVAPIVDDPTLAVPLPEAVAALRALASLPQTTVAVVSGRALRDLAALSRLPAEVHLVGSHGSEFDVGFVDALAPDLQELRAELAAALTALARRRPGVRLEMKPASVAVHLRSASPDVARLVSNAVRTGPAGWTGINVTEGKEVIELSVISTDKGLALEALRSQLSASAVVFLGDDVTDEKAFARLAGPDLGVKVGPGDTRAGYRVTGPVDAARLLGLLLRHRQRWLFGERAVPIERHSMLSNGRTVALLTPDARVSWLCQPRPDSAALFAELLGGPSAGHFTVTGERNGLPLGQRYLPHTMTLETRWPGLAVTDWLDTHPGDDLRPDNAATVLVRVLSGQGRARLEFAPRPEFGQLPVRLQPVGEGLLVLGSSDPIALYSPGVDWAIREDGGNEIATAVVDLAAAGRVTLELRLGTADLDHHPVPVADRQRAAGEHSREWVRSLVVPQWSREQVIRSALTLRGLCHQPTGAIIAAATASLPEWIGGVRNWDYRYCWLRDAAMTAHALVELGSTDEAERLLGWLNRVAANTGGHPERIHPLYALDGDELGAEAVIDTLSGYAGSRPVRVGNAASHQVQLDVFGPVTDLIAAVSEHRGLTPEDVELVKLMVEAVKRRWHEPDHGIWEARLPPRHHVYSKVMCWLTVDRAIAMGGRGMPVGRDWRVLREAIANDVLTHGWHPGAEAFTLAYGCPDLDASALWIGLSGLLAVDDPRFLSTVLAVEAELRSGATVYRYLADDGMPGREGGFHICTAWLVEAYLRTGRRTEAEELFQRMVDTAGPTGLLPEQYDPEAEQGLGNHPQAYSHISLIRCALLLDGDAEAGR